MKERVSLKISGRVQGVFFRKCACDEANRFKLSGWIRNGVDGTVEVTAEGEKERLEQFIQWCYHGPRGAMVENIQIEHLPATGEFQGFKVFY